MEFNYGAEKKKFEDAWKQLAITYAEAGMSPEAIQEMYEYDWDRFKAARVEALHTQELTLPPEMDDGTYPAESPLMDKFLPRLSNEYDTFGSHSRYWWLDELENPCLAVGVPALTTEEKELLTLVIIDRCSTREIARRMQLPQRTAARKLARVFSRFRQEP